MTDYTCVLPSIYQPWTDACLEHCQLDNLQIVENNIVNLGVARSWNMGVDAMMGTGAQWLVIISAAVRFNRDYGGLDLLPHLDANPDAYAVEAGHGIGWHLIAFHRRAFDTVGRFDENFYPAYGEDIDFGRRLYLALGETAPMWPKVSLEVGLQGFAHGVDLGGAVVNPDLMHAYMQNKWNDTADGPGFRTPFGLDVPLSYWPQPCECRHPQIAHNGPGASCDECSCVSFSPSTMSGWGGTRSEPGSTERA